MKIAPHIFSSPKQPLSVLLKPTVILTFVISLFWGQATAQRNRFSGWFSVTQNIRINDKFSVQFDNQLRTTDQWKTKDIYFLRAGAMMSLKKGYSIGAGYFFIDFWRTVNNVYDDISENRLYQQIQFAKEYKKTFFQHRIRIEERWMPVIGIRNSKFYKQSEQINSRLRYWARWQWPFSGKTNFQNGFYGCKQDELMFNLTGKKYTNNMFFDQVRSYTGIGYRLNKTMDIEAGHMFICAINRSKQSMITNAIQITTAFRW